MTGDHVDHFTGEIIQATAGFRELGSDEALGKLYLALGKAQAAFHPISRSKTVQIRGQAANYSFDYAPLEDLLAATRKALTDNGLVVLTPIYRWEGEAQVLVILAHEAGARIIVPFGFTPQAEIKGLGAQITYLRRYGYAALLNLTADSDADDQPSPDPVSKTRTFRKPENERAEGDGITPISPSSSEPSMPATGMESVVSSKHSADTEQSRWEVGSATPAQMRVIHGLRAFLHLEPLGPKDSEAFSFNEAADLVQELNEAKAMKAEAAS